MGVPARLGLIEVTAASLEAGGWRVFVAHGPEAARRHLRTLLTREDELALHDVPLWADIGAGPAAEAGTVVHAFTGRPDERTSARTRADVREILARCSWGVTGATAVIAETGTVLLAEDDGFGRLVSNLPYRHLVLAEAASVVSTLDEALAAIRREDGLQRGGASARYLSAISGPSRTGDIQMEMVQGMHGPGEAHIVLLDAAPAPRTEAETERTAQ